MPSVLLHGGPLDGDTLVIPAEEWPLFAIRTDDGLYEVDDDTNATFVEAGGGDGGSDPLAYAVGPPGDQGPEGPEGPPGPAGDDGADGLAVGPVWQGEWDDAADYGAFDGVSHDGSSYYATEAIPAADGIEPPSSPWALLAARGDIGPAGATGPAGPTGPAGSGGGGTGTLTWEGEWTAGSYDEGAVVVHDGDVWVALTTTTDEPAAGTGGTAAPVVDTAQSEWVDTTVAHVTVPTSSTQECPTIFGGGTKVRVIAFRTAVGASGTLRCTNVSGVGSQAARFSVSGLGTPTYDAYASLGNTAYMDVPVGSDQTIAVALAWGNGGVQSEWDLTWTGVAPTELVDMGAAAADWDLLAPQTITLAALGIARGTATITPSGASGTSGNIAHGLGVTPAQIILTPRATSDTREDYAMTTRSRDATNFVAGVRITAFEHYGWTAAPITFDWVAFA